MWGAPREILGFDPVSAVDLRRYGMNIGRYSVIHTLGRYSTYLHRQKTVLVTVEGNVPRDNPVLSLPLPP